MIARSTRTPIAPTTSGATTSMATQMLTPEAVGLDRGVAAEHQELAVREVDDLHHAEDDRQPHADQGEAGDRIENLDRQERCEIHERSARRSAQNLITYC